mmetsp:Transcript_81218/g.226098  ORF Transcript_81218/g.226098 Transcript_81218/m.226098 type:complete len:203 (+) Transcript_81218:505-1113(+)
MERGEKVVHRLLLFVSTGARLSSHWRELGLHPFIVALLKAIAFLPREEEHTVLAHPMSLRSPNRFQIKARSIRTVATSSNNLAAVIATSVVASGFAATRVDLSCVTAVGLYEIVELRVSDGGRGLLRLEQHLAHGDGLPPFPHALGAEVLDVTLAIPLILRSHVSVVAFMVHHPAARQRLNPSDLPSVGVLHMDLNTWRFSA